MQPNAQSILNDDPRYEKEMKRINVLDNVVVANGSEHPVKENGDSTSKIAVDYVKGALCLASLLVVYALLTWF